MRYKNTTFDYVDPYIAFFDGDKVRPVEPDEADDFAELPEYVQERSWVQVTNMVHPPRAPAP